MIDRFDHLFLRPADFERSLAFYRDTLGWSVVATWGGTEGGRGAVLSGGACRLVLAEGAAEGVSRQADEGRPRIHFDIHDIDERFRHLPPGEHVVIAPEDTGRGSRWFIVRDPDGNLIAFEEASRASG